MSKQLTVPSHVEATVRRPDGTVETIKVPNSTQWGPRDFALAKAGMHKAGRGEVLAYTNVTQQIDEPADYALADAAERAYDAHVAAVYRAMDVRGN